MFDETGLCSMINIKHAAAEGEMAGGFGSNPMRNEKNGVWTAEKYNTHVTSF